MQRIDVCRQHTLSLSSMTQYSRNVLKEDDQGAFLQVCNISCLSFLTICLYKARQYLYRTLLSFMRHIFCYLVFFIYPLTISLVSSCYNVDIHTAMQYCQYKRSRMLFIVDTTVLLLPIHTCYRTIVLVFLCISAGFGRRRKVNDFLNFNCASVSSCFVSLISCLRKSSRVQSNS